MQRVAVVVVIAWATLASACATPQTEAHAATDPQTSYSAGVAAPQVTSELPPEPRTSRSGPGVDSDAWRISLAPYVWIPSVGASFENDRSGSAGSHDGGDTAEETSLSASFHAEFGHGAWSLFGDATWLATELDGNASVTPARGGKPLDVDLRTRVDGFLVETGVAWRAFEYCVGGRNAPFELLGGARLNAVSFETDLDLARGNSAADFSGDADGNWVDPFLGLRTRVPLGDSFALSARGDIGLTSGSENAYNAVGCFEWAVSKNVSLALGYRYYKIERDLDNTHIGLTLKGPELGVIIRF